MKAGDLMEIELITVTGADDKTDIDWMVELSDQYSKLEWGILVSHTGTGLPRFPGHEWQRLLLNRWQTSQLRLCTHICGRWVREICAGDWHSFMLQNGALAALSERLQLNFHALTHRLEDKFFEVAASNQETYDWSLIFQQDGLNEELSVRARQAGLDVELLFDKSGGTGQLPSGWPAQPPAVFCGYAGGLSADNLTEQLDLISQQATGSIWIDVETHVRTADGSSLDRSLVERFIETASRYGKQA